MISTPHDSLDTDHLLKYVEISQFDRGTSTSKMSSRYWCGDGAENPHLSNHIRTKSIKVYRHVGTMGTREGTHTQTFCVRDEAFPKWGSYLVVTCSYLLCSYVPSVPRLIVKERFRENCTSSPPGAHASASALDIPWPTEHLWQSIPSQGALPRFLKRNWMKLVIVGPCIKASTIHPNWPNHPNLPPSLCFYILWI